MVSVKYEERIQQLQQQVDLLNTILVRNIPTINSNSQEIMRLKAMDYRNRLNLLMEEKNQLDAWTGKRCSRVLFDSTVDKWARETSTFDTKIMNHPHIVLLIEDTRGNKFGCYLHEPITQYGRNTNDPNAFVFSLQSQGRLRGMMKFPILLDNEAAYLYPKDIGWLISIGSDGGKKGLDDITIMKSDCQTVHPGNGCCQQSFNYYGHQNALCGQNWFKIQRFLVFTME